MNILSFMGNVYKVLLGLDSIVYSFICYTYKLFLILARINLFDAKDSYEFVQRIYQVIGVIMLFMLSYAILRKIVNPDAKDKESTGKMIFSVVRAIILLALVPTIFGTAFKIQTAVLDANVIGKLILGTTRNSNNTSDSLNKVKDKGGVTMASGVFNAFLYPASGDDNTVIKGTTTFKQYKDSVENNENFIYYQELAEEIDNNDNASDNAIVYHWFISTVAGIFVLYILISYCLSLGLRIVKLAFYEIMAPVCIIASVLPSQKEMLSRWIKATLSTFTEVFIRIAVLYFSIYVIKLVTNRLDDGKIFDGMQVGNSLKLLSIAVIIMGVITFMKSAPELISKLTGVDSGNMSLGIKDQLAKGGFFTAGAVVGGAAMAGARSLASGIIGGATNAYQTRQGVKAGTISASDAKKQYRQAVWTGAKGALRAVPGALSGGIHGFSKDAKDLKSMKEAAKKGYTTAGANAAKRSSYISSHGGVAGAVKGKVTDALTAAGRGIGFRDPELVRAELEQVEGMQTSMDSLQDAGMAMLQDAMKKNKNTQFMIDDGVLNRFNSASGYQKKINLNDDMKQALTKLGLYDSSLEVYDSTGAMTKAGYKSNIKTALDLKDLEMKVKTFLRDPNERHSEYMQEAFNVMQKEYSKLVANQGLVSQEKYASWVNEAQYNANSTVREQYSEFIRDLGKVTEAGTKLRGNITRGLEVQAVKDVGISYNDVNPHMDIDLSDTRFKSLDDRLKDEQNSLRVQLAKMNEADKTKGDDKK